MQPTPQAQSQDIVETAVGAGQFKTLVTALKAAGLVDTLKGPGPFTVFAPSDDAFNQLPKAMIEDLLRPENKQRLRDILTYHVVPGKVMASQAKTVSSANTVQGRELKMSEEDGALKIGKAHVIKPDVTASNGVIHVIDAVLIPE